MSIKIKDLNFGEWPYGGWGWTVVRFDEIDDQEVVEHFATDRSGCGLWGIERDQAGVLCNPRQIEGTCQFSLPTREAPALKNRVRARIRKYFEE